MSDVLPPADPAAPAHTDPAAAVRRDAKTSPSHIDWPAIFVGAVLATSIAFVLNSFGAAIGLSVMSPFGEDGIGSMGVLIAVAVWMIWVLVSSYMAGAYVTGRMRRRLFDATEHESEVRDGVHGLAVWALGVLLSAVVLASATGTVLRAGSDVVASVGTTAVETVADQSYDYELNRLLRSTNPNSFNESREVLYEDIVPILQRTVEEGSMTEEDKVYVAQVVSSETSLTQQEAAQRVEQVETAVLQAKQETIEAAETAQTATILSAFVLAAALLISAAGSWWAAGVGGAHRDEETVIRWLSHPRR